MDSYPLITDHGLVGELQADRAAMRGIVNVAEAEPIRRSSG